MVVPLVVLIVEIAVDVEELVARVCTPQAGRRLAASDPVITRVLRLPVEETPKRVSNPVQPFGLRRILCEQDVVADARLGSLEHRSQIDSLEHPAASLPRRLPASPQIVAARSTCVASASVAVPGLVMPGTRMYKGTRIISS